MCGCRNNKLVPLPYANAPILGSWIQYVPSNEFLGEGFFIFIFAPSGDFEIVFVSSKMGDKPNGAPEVGRLYWGTFSITDETLVLTIPETVSWAAFKRQFHYTFSDDSENVLILELDSDDRNLDPEDKTHVLRLLFKAHQPVKWGQPPK